MFNLWGDLEDTPLPQRTTRPLPQPARPQSPLTSLDCFLYGHTWQRIGLSGEKRCTVCGIVGYCPGCTPNPPAGAQPFRCSQHTQPPAPVQEGRS